jgi:DNA adenine methylase
MNNHKIFVPPVKIQGKKTKLVSFILKNLPADEFDVWVEPFMGSGVVGFNVQPKKAVFADSNPHIINFYNAIKTRKITPQIAQEFLQEQGALLSEKGQDYFNEVRQNFNTEHQSLDFLFLNRSCFNGMIRFNRKFQFNVPYGHKPERFAQSYITKITNQIKQVQFFIKNNDWTFVCQDFKTTLSNLPANSLVYCDPPYIGRHVDYYDSWDEQNETDLEKILQASKAKFIVSTWHSNKYRTNIYLQTLWSKYNLETIQHFYHLGGKEENRNSVTEALILNYSPPNKFINTMKKQTNEQLVLFKIG